MRIRKPISLLQQSKPDTKKGTSIVRFPRLHLHGRHRLEKSQTLVVPTMLEMAKSWTSLLHLAIQLQMQAYIEQRRLIRRLHTPQRPQQSLRVAMTSTLRRTLAKARAQLLTSLAEASLETRTETLRSVNQVNRRRSLPYSQIRSQRQVAATGFLSREEQKRQLQLRIVKEAWSLRG